MMITIETVRQEFLSAIVQKVKVKVKVKVEVKVKETFLIQTCQFLEQHLPSTST